MKGELQLVAGDDACAANALRGCLREDDMTIRCQEKHFAAFERLAALTCCQRMVRAGQRCWPCNTCAYVIARTHQNVAAQQMKICPARTAAGPTKIGAPARLAQFRCVVSKRPRHATGPSAQAPRRADWHHAPRSPAGAMDTDTLPSRNSANISTRRSSKGYSKLISARPEKRVRMAGEARLA